MRAPRLFLPGIALAILVLVPVLIPAASIAQVCSGPGNIGYTAVAGTIDAPRNCLNLFWCHDPITAGVEYRLLPANCDPTAGSCTVRAVASLQFPGNHNNSTGIGFFDSPAKLVWEDSQNNFVGACGNAAARIQDDEGETWIQRSFECGDSGGGDIYELKITVCDGVSGCEKNASIMVDFTDTALGVAVCPPPPEENDCEDCGCLSPGSGGPSGGAAPPSGGGGASGGQGTGPGVHFFYKAGGIGAIGQPGSATWEHGRYWSHTYAQRIVEHASDPDIAYLVTPAATYRTFTDDNSDSTYDTVSPASDYRTLVRTGGGWTLTDLEGTVTSFRLDGLWTGIVDKNGNTTTGTYNGSQLESVAMPDGRREDFTYDGSGKMIEVDEVGVDGTTSRAWTYTWSGSDLTRIDRPDGTALKYRYDDPMHDSYLTRATLEGMDGTSERVLAAFQYDSRGNVLKLWAGATDFASGVGRWEMSYDNPVLPTVTTITDPLGNVSTRTWAPRNAVTEKARLSSTDGDCPVCGMGPNSQMGYNDPTNPYRVTDKTDGRGTVTKYQYDADGQMTSRLEAFMTVLERETTWDYEPAYPAFATEIRQPSVEGLPEMRIASRAYDGSGNQTSSTQEGFEDGAPFSYSTTYGYNAGGRLTSIDPPGHGTADVTTFAYDATRGNGHLVLESRTDPIVGDTTFAYDAFNRQTSVTDPNGVVSETQYDLANRVLFQVQKGTIPAEDLITEHRYNTFGDLSQTVLPEGNVIEYSYDAAGRLLTIERKADDQPTTHGERVRFELDGVGNRTLEAQERWESGAWVEHARTEFEFSTRCYLDQTISGSGVQAAVTEYSYDCNGNLDRIWDANHPSNGQMNPATTENVYDALDRLEEVRQPFGGAVGGTMTTGYAYDVQDHLVQVTDGEGTVTSYEYSDRDLMTEEVSEVSGTTTYTYNEHGEQTQKTDARGITETRSLDAFDRVTQVDFPDDSLDISYTYDDPQVDFSLGRLTRLERGGHPIDFRYDRFGRMTQDGQLGHAYDRNGNPTRVLYPGGEAAVTTFDFADRPSTLLVEIPNETDLPLVTASTYEPAGPLAEVARGNGLIETRAHDRRYYPASIIVGDGVSTLLDWQYTTDHVGNPTAIVDALDAANNRTYAYQDFQYFLSQGNGPWGTRTWTYDKIGNRLTEAADGGAADSYIYTPNAATGNSPKLDHIDLGLGGQHTFQYDAAGNQTQANLAGNVIDRAYDDAGRMSRQERAAAEATSTFVYDARSFLSRAEGSAPDTTGNALFCDGFESGSTTSWGSTGTCFATETTQPLYSSGGVLHARDEELVVYFGDHPIAQRLPDGAWLHLTPDHLGTPVLATDSSATMVWEAGFEPFGRDDASATEAGVFLRFPGQWEDGAWEDSGVGDTVRYNVHRWYQQQTGKYSRPDPKGISGDANLYVYVRANPIVLLDPKGLFSIDPSCLCSETSPSSVGWPQGRIQVEVNTACLQLDQQVGDPKLRRCMKKSCQKGRISCKPCGKTGDGLQMAGMSENIEILGFRPFVNRTAVFCTDGIPNYPPPGWFADLALHEWAHGCRWRHEDGGGIPSLTDGQYL